MDAIKLAGLGLLASVTACTSSPQPPPPPQSQLVPLDVSSIAAETTCLEIADDEKLLAVSPEGDAWLLAAGARLRVVSPDGAETQRPLPFPNLDQGHALSDDDLVFIAEGGLFRQQGEYLDEVLWPEGVAAPSDFCGNPSVDGQAFVVAGDLFERAAGQWWRWSPRQGSFGAIQAIADVGGACAGKDRRVWLQSDTGLWSVSPADVSRIEVVANPRQIAADESFGVAAVSGDVLMRGPAPWAELRFEAGAVQQIAASTGALYVAAGGRLYREQAQQYDEIVLDAPGAADGLHAHEAGGLWIERGSSLCHASTAPIIRVRGLRPYERTFDTSRDLAVIANATDVEVSLDGTPVPTTSSDDGRHELPALPLGAAGWHTLEVRAGGQTRRLEYEVLELDARTWAVDIVPIYEASCAGSTCHGADRDDVRRPDLSTYEGWTENAVAIRNRVGMVGDMPPLELRDGWGPDQVVAIVEWVDRGMVRGDE